MNKDMIKIILFFILLLAIVFISYRILSGKTGSQKNANIKDSEIFYQDTDTKTPQTTNFLVNFIDMYNKDKKNQKTEPITKDKEEKDEKLRKIGGNNLVFFDFLYENDDSVTIVTSSEDGQVSLFEILDNKISKTNVKKTTIQTQKALLLGKDSIVQYYITDLPKLVISKFPETNQNKKDTKIINNVVDFDAYKKHLYYITTQSRLLLHEGDIALDTPLKNMNVFVFSDRIYVLSKPSKNNNSVLFKLEEGEFIPVLFNKKELIGRKYDNYLILSDKENVYILDENDKIKKIDLKTYPQKCAISDEKMFCFVPDKISDRLLWQQGFAKTTDYLYVYDIKTGISKIIYPTIKDNYDKIDATNVLFAKESIYFINRYDGKLYEIYVK